MDNLPFFLNPSLSDFSDKNVSDSIICNKLIVILTVTVTIGIVTEVCTGEQTWTFIPFRMWD